MKLPIAVGVARLARFDASGLDAFGTTPAALLNALAPWIAITLVGFMLVLFGGAAAEALGDLLATLIALLTPAVVSEALAHLWRRDDAWLRYAVAFTWCQWLMPPALLAAVLLTNLLAAIGVPADVAERLGGFAALAYLLALHGFLAYRALDLSRWRAATMVAFVNIGTSALVLGPLLMQVAWERPA